MENAHGGLAPATLMRSVGGVCPGERHAYQPDPPAAGVHACFWEPLLPWTVSDRSLRGKHRGPVRGRPSVWTGNSSAAWAEVSPLSLGQRSVVSVCVSALHSEFLQHWFGACHPLPDPPRP